MKLNDNDKSLLLLVAALIAIVWVVFSVFSRLYSSATFSTSDASKIIVKEDQWFNVSRPLELHDLKDRIILLNFWTYSCVNCKEATAEIQKFEQELGSKITVIGVHSGKFSNEKDSSEITKFILKNNISHPVVNDADSKIRNDFKVSSLPTLILINPHGNIVKTYTGEIDFHKLKGDVKKLIKKFKFEIDHEILPLASEKKSMIGNVLDFPTKLTYAVDFLYKSRHSSAIFVANSAHNNIVVSSLTGDIILKIGSGKDGFEDGSIDAASFSKPQGLLYDAGKLYVADTGNHALRVVDFKENKVTTLIGSGNRGAVIEGEMLEGKSTNLALPTDIEFFPHKNNIVIANAGTNQILSYDVSKQIVSVLAGDGAEGIDDGKYPENSLAQTAALSAFGHKLYFVDSQTSALRVMDESGNIKTLIGKGLTEFGHKSGNKANALMQYPLGLVADDTGVYISDSFNHGIVKYDLSTGQIRDFIGGKVKGDAIGNVTQFDEPSGIISILDRFYIVDSNNNRIVIVSRGSLNSELLDIMPPLKLPKEGFLEYMPNLQKSADAKVKSDAEILLKINVEKGWKINEAGPSFINLLEIVKDHQANLITSFDWHMVAAKEMKLPKLDSSKNYVLQGSIYYCEDRKNALCRIKSYEQKISADSSEKSLEIEMKLGS